MRTLLIAAMLAAMPLLDAHAAPPASPAAVADPALTQAITAALGDSAAAWSRGDLDAFMSLYEHSPTIAYINASGMTHGYDGIRAMYAARFAKGEPMGELSIAVLETVRTGPDYAFVTGRYTLRQASGQVASGLTTLLFHRQGGHWRIVSDHTS